MDREQALTTLRTVQAAEERVLRAGASEWLPVAAFGAMAAGSVPLALAIGGSWSSVERMQSVFGWYWVAAVPLTMVAAALLHRASPIRQRPSVAMIMAAVIVASVLGAVVLPSVLLGMQQAAAPMASLASAALAIFGVRTRNGIAASAGFLGIVLGFGSQFVASHQPLVLAAGLTSIFGVAAALLRSRGRRRS